MLKGKITHSKEQHQLRKEWRKSEREKSPSAGKKTTVFISKKKVEHQILPLPFLCFSLCYMN